MGYFINKAMPRKITQEEFIDIASKTHNYKYDYSKVKYINSQTKVCIICPIHGEFWQRPAAHIHHKHGCSKCRSDSMRNIIFGVGINDYEGSIKNKNKFISSYTCWRNMLCRCYSKEKQKELPSYIGCTVCSEWLHFSIFKQWYDENYREGYELDKDILSQNSKCYSPQTCIFVPNYLNNLFRIRKDGKNGMGVFYYEKYKKYIGRFTFRGKIKYTKVFDNEAEARKAYKELRLSEIKRIAGESFASGDIDERLYNALLNYEIKEY